jgi:muramoyltetrapeptide carboxypeptidase
MALPPQGATLAIISPAAPSPPAVLQAGYAWLRQQGFNVKPLPHVASQARYLAGTAAQQAEDLHAAFEDPEVDAILCTRGGYGSGRLLPLLDWERLRAALAQKPKLLMGFSDITMLQVALYQGLGLASLYSPMLVPNLLPEDQTFTRTQWRRTLDATQWEALPFVVANQDPYHCLVAGQAQGPLLGGNLSLLCALSGTPWQPNTAGHVLFIEDWKESDYTLDRQLTQLAQAGWFEGIAGLILADFSKITRPEGELEPPSVAELLASLVGRLGLPAHVPVGYGLTLGHGEQTTCLPQGLQAHFCATTGQLQVMETLWS